MLVGGLIQHVRNGVARVVHKKSTPVVHIATLDDVVDLHVHANVKAARTDDIDVSAARPLAALPRHGVAHLNHLVGRPDSIPSLIHVGFAPDAPT